MFFHYLKTILIFHLLWVFRTYSSLFIYIIFTVEKRQRVSFMTTMDRELFPIKMPRNRFGNEIVPLRGTPHTGPGCYENEDVRHDF